MPKWTSRLKLIASRPPTWSGLRWLGDSRLLRSSFVWIIVVPVVARAVDSVGDSFPIADIRLPFSWTAFYFSALFVAAGNLVYMLRCPAIVQAYRGYSDFTQQGKGADQLRRELEELYYQHSGSMSPEHVLRNLEEFAASFCAQPLSEPQKTSLQNDPSSAVNVAAKLAISADKQGEAFWALRSLADMLRPGWRWVCLAFFSTGLALILVVLYQNAAYVTGVTLENWRKSDMASAMQPASPGSRFVWLKFQGRGVKRGDHVILSPELDSRIELTLRSADVRSFGPTFEVRSGSKLVDLVVPADSPLNGNTNESPPGWSHCEGNPTMCVGGIELCCHNRQVVGSCAGYWRCP